MTHRISIEQLKTRLSNVFSEKEIQALIDEHSDASTDEMPNMDLIGEIVNKDKNAELNVRFILKQEEFDSLQELFEEHVGKTSNINGTVLVKLAIDIFLKSVE